MVSAGLARVLKQQLSGRGYLEGRGGWSSSSGAKVELELGYRPLDWLTLYGQGRWTSQETQALGGARVEF